MYHYVNKRVSFKSWQLYFKMFNNYGVDQTCWLIKSCQFSSIQSGFIVTKKDHNRALLKTIKNPGMLCKIQARAGRRLLLKL